MRLAKRRRVGHDDPMAVVTRFLDAANHHDSDALYANVHPEFESFQPLHPDRNFRGPGQLISNWKAIFEAEPGFRLTVLRASTTGSTVWVEIHGAGEDAEAAGIFIVGVEHGRIRWVRVYSDLVQGVEAIPDPVPAPISAAPPAGDGDTGAVAEGPLRLVEPAEDPAPETDGGSGPVADTGLHVVDDSASEPGDGHTDPEPDVGPVETLVGPSRNVSPPPSSDETPSSDGLWLPDWTGDQPGAAAEDADAGGAFPAVDTPDDQAPVESDADADSDADTDTDTGEQSAVDEDSGLGPESAGGAQSFDSGPLPQEPRRSRWRKALRKF